MYEFAITAGEGRLIEYGCAYDDDDLFNAIWRAIGQGFSLIFDDAGDNCYTGS